MKKRTRTILTRIALFTPFGLIGILFFWFVTDSSFKECIKALWDE